MTGFYEWKVEIVIDSCYRLGRGVVRELTDT